MPLADGDYRSAKEFYPAWVDYKGNLVETATIPAGAGFWFYKGTTVTGTVTATFSR